MGPNPRLEQAACRFSPSGRFCSGRGERERGGGLTFFTLACVDDAQGETAEIVSNSMVNFLAMKAGVPSPVARAVLTRCRQAFCARPGLLWAPTAQGDLVATFYAALATKSHSSVQPFGLGRERF
jgi:hypothetical protein